jgi:phosphoglycerate dehydrogenase-like enzyme
MKIAVLDDYSDSATRLADWSDLGEVTVFREHLGGATEVVEWLQPFDVVCVMRERTPLPASVIEALPNLRLIVTTGPRNISIDMAAARSRGITVCGTESRKTTAAELAMTLILALNRRIVPEAARLAAGGWQKELGRDLAGLTLGLVGLGSIGAQMANLGRAFGMKIAAWSQNLTAERCAELGVRQCDSLKALMAASDVVSVQLVLSERTRGLIGARAFAAMRPGAVFVNTSRGPIVDSDALLDGLRAGRPHMAGLDVFDVEPLPGDHPLLNAGLIDEGRLLLTPHLGYATETSFRMFYGQTVEAIRAWAAGSPVRVLNG